jgi:hypothetical protein
MHSTIKISPNSFNISDGERIKKETQIRSFKGDEEIMLFNIGDKVRILKSKKQFAKGSDKFSKQIYEIAEINRRSFILKNAKLGELLSKYYKNWQLQPIMSNVKSILNEEPNRENIESKQLEISEPPKIKQHSSKEIRKDNKMKRLQNKEFGEGKGHEVQEINDNNEVVYKSKLKPRNTTREKPKIGFEIGDKVKSEFIENGSKKWYNGNVVKVNRATYKVKFSDGQILNMKKDEVLAGDIETEQQLVVTTNVKVQPKNKPKVLTRNDIKENDRISVYWPKDKQSYNATVKTIKKGGWYELAYDDGERITKDLIKTNGKKFRNRKRKLKVYSLIQHKHIIINLEARDVLELVPEFLFPGSFQLGHTQPEDFTLLTTSSTELEIGGEYFHLFVEIVEGPFGRLEVVSTVQRPGACLFLCNLPYRTRTIARLLCGWSKRSTRTWQIPDCRVASRSSTGRCTSGWDHFRTGQGRTHTILGSRFDFSQTRQSNQSTGSGVLCRRTEGQEDWQSRGRQYWMIPHGRRGTFCGT